MLKSLYVVETGRGVRAECKKKEDAYSQADEYLSNFGGEIWLYHYIIENPDIRYQVEDGELDFYIDDDYIHMDEREDYGVGRCLIKRLSKDFIS